MKAGGGAGPLCFLANTVLPFTRAFEEPIAIAFGF
jgi:hypothetical protein